jgi:hypothetical protein
LRMLVDLRASVDQALGRGKATEAQDQSGAKKFAAPAAKPAMTSAKTSKGGPVTEKRAASAAVAGGSGPSGKAAAASASAAKATVAPDNPNSSASEFEVSSTPGWDSDSESQAGSQAGSQPGKKS